MREINPEETTRAEAFRLWMDAPMPMVTLIKTVDVTRLVRFSRRKGLKLNMLMCWCVGRAASGIKEFYMLPVGRKLMQYDSIAVNTIVADSRGEVSSCDIPWSEDLAAFNRDYLRLTAEVAEKCRNHDITDSMVIGTSALAFPDMGPVQAAFLPQDPDRLIPVPPHPDGRSARRDVPRPSPESRTAMIKSILLVGLGSCEVALEYWLL